MIVMTIMIMMMMMVTMMMIMMMMSIAKARKTFILLTNPNSSRSQNPKCLVSSTQKHVTLLTIRIFFTAAEFSSPSSFPFAQYY